jgi:hypothetical protein
MKELQLSVVGTVDGISPAADGQYNLWLRFDTGSVMTMPLSSDAAHGVTLGTRVMVKLEFPLTDLERG